MGQDMILPNLVIAGAPKCGSTSLYHYLAAHPEVCAASKQETRYLIDRGYSLFNNDFNYFSHGLEGYSQFFRHCATTKRHIFLDCTPDYLYQKTALSVLSELEPRPIVIFILRDPVMRAYSLFQYARNNMAVVSHKLSFHAFVAQVKELKAEYLKNRLILRNTLEHGKYINYLKMWLEKFGSKSLQVLLFEDMKNDPRSFMKQLALNIGIDDEFYDDFNFEVKNPTVTVRSQVLHRFKMRWSYKLKISLIRNIGAYLYNNLNIKPGVSLGSSSFSIQDKRTMQTLYSEFEDSNRELAELFDIDLSVWRSLT